MKTFLHLFALLFDFLILLTSGLRSVRLLDVSDRFVPYSEAWKWQQKLVDYHIELQQSDKNPHHVGSILMLQHPSVYTLGTATTENSGPFSFVAKDGTALQYETFQIDRAGQATYHGPGQIVCYPILDLNYFEKDIHAYLRNLEEVVIRTLKCYDIQSSRKEGLTGVWVGERKFAAMGIKLRRWVTMHGLALNVKPDLRYFDNIVPCGIQDKAVGSMVQMIPDINQDNVKDSLAKQFESVFGCELDRVEHQMMSAILAL